MTNQPQEQKQKEQGQKQQGHKPDDAQRVPQKHEGSHDSKSSDANKNNKSSSGNR